MQRGDRKVGRTGTPVERSYAEIIDIGVVRSAVALRTHEKHKAALRGKAGIRWEVDDHVLPLGGSVDRHRVEHRDGGEVGGVGHGAYKEQRVGVACIESEGEADARRGVLHLLQGCVAVGGACGVEAQALVARTWRSNDIRRRGGAVGAAGPAGVEGACRAGGVAVEGLAVWQRHDAAAGGEGAARGPLAMATARAVGTHAVVVVGVLGEAREHQTVGGRGGESVAARVAEIHCGKRAVCNLEGAARVGIHIPRYGGMAAVDVAHGDIDRYVAAHTRDGNIVDIRDSVTVGTGTRHLAERYIVYCVGVEHGVVAKVVRHSGEGGRVGQHHEGYE